jgi:Holliday junction resolvase RusA-like endonuclease
MTSLDSRSPDHSLVIRMPLFSKARPRLTKTGHAYMPQDYKNRQAEMRRQMREQWAGPPLDGPLMLKILLNGEARYDGDNAAGAAMDCGTGIIWRDDTVSIIPRLIVEWRKAAKKESFWQIEIWELSAPIV